MARKRKARGLETEDRATRTGPQAFAGSGTRAREGARRRLERFLQRDLRNYHTERDHPGKPATSRLSPHLHFGEIGPRQVAALLDSTDPGPGPDAYLRELGWREFSHHLLFHNPDMESSGLRPEFERMPWRRDPAGLERWQQGLTGYPLVDAGMRELWTTGWMHNRVRMVTASFLTKHLLIDWRLGADWFLDTLVDADRASNSAGWQWVAGCGSDAAPYFPHLQPCRTVAALRILPVNTFEPGCLNCSSCLTVSYMPPGRHRKGC